MINFTNIAPDASACAELVDRLRRRDATLWSSDPAVRRSIDNRLGWLDAAAFMDRHTGRIVDFADRVQAEGYQQAVLLGMGGSSLAPEVYAALFGGRDRGIALTVLDTTSPQQVARVTGGCERAATLFIVSSKSGTTAETSALDAHFYHWASSRFDRPGDHFVAISDSGSPLEALAAERGYRETFLNPADIGGRFSALSFFGLVPAALAGADLAALRAHLPDEPRDSELAADACALGTALGSLAREGRNKLTLQLCPTLDPVAAWIEQLIDESTGKNDTGIVVIAGESRFEPAEYAADRVFAVVDLEDDPVDPDWVDALARSGQPVARWRLSGTQQISAEFLRWEIATALAGRVLGINPFDEPDVDDSKATTRAILERPDRASRSTGQPLSDLDRLLDRAGPGDYLAILAYFPPTGENRRRIQSWGRHLSRRTGLPCCVGFGPRYLHSSGQLHKGGPDQGLFIVVTDKSRTGPDLPIPGRGHGFGTLFDAQAHGDLQVLKDRDRRVVHLEFDEAGLDQLAGAARPAVGSPPDP